jgi:hypothetical protein
MKRIRPSDVWFFLARLFRVTRVVDPDTSSEGFTFNVSVTRPNPDGRNRTLSPWERHSCRDCAIPVRRQVPPPSGAHCVHEPG